MTQKSTIPESIDAAIRTNKMEGLDVSPDYHAILDRVKSGEISLDELGKLLAVRHTKLAENQTITYDDALKVVRGLI